MSGLRARLVVRRPSGFSLDVAFEAPAGATVALLGPNGAGKSTAVWALAGVVPLDEGSIELDGRVLDDPAAGVFVPPEHRRVGAVFQDVLLFPHLSALANVAFAARSAADGARAATAAARTWLERLGVDDLAGMRPSQLSGGQAQLVGVARALAADPRLLLLDEPLSSLDVAARARVRGVLARHLAGFGGPRVVVTHDPAEAAVLADTVVVIEDGRVTQTGTPGEILHAPRTRYAADLAGLNLIAGTAAGGTVRVAGGIDVRIADTGADGDVLLTIHPRAVAVHRQRPEGSARNAWRAAVESVEALGGTCRVVFGGPLPLTAEITVAARDDLGLVPGTEAWVAVKATEIGVQPG